MSREFDYILPFEDFRAQQVFRFAVFFGLFSCPINDIALISEYKRVPFGVNFLTAQAGYFSRFCLSENTICRGVQGPINMLHAVNPCARKTRNKRSNEGVKQAASSNNSNLVECFIIAIPYQVFQIPTTRSGLDEFSVEGI